MVPEKLRELLRRKLLSPTVKQHQHVSYRTCLASAQLQQGQLVFQRYPLRVGIARQSLQVFIGQRLDGWFFRFADPRNGQLHTGI